MIQLRVWKYEASATDYKGQELTDFVIQGSENTEDLTQEVDTTEITLYGIDRAENFAPSTKFILEVWQNGEMVAHYDRVVKQDLVNKPIIDDNTYFVHNISLEEPSVLAQKELVDNIACTYKLKDVSLDDTIAFDLTRKTNWTKGSPKFNGTCRYFDDGFSERKIFASKYIEFDRKPRLQFTFGGVEEIPLIDGYVNISRPTATTLRNGDIVQTDNFYVKTEYVYNNSVKIILPQLKLFTMDYNQSGQTLTEFKDKGAISYDFTITELNEAGQVIRTVNGGTTNKKAIISNTNLALSTPNGIFEAYPNHNTMEYIWEDCKPKAPFILNIKERKVTDITAPTPIYESDTFQVNDGCSYKISYSLHDFGVSDSVAPNYPMRKYLYYDLQYITLVGLPVITETSHSYTEEDVNFYNITQEFFVYSSATLNGYFKHSNPYSAMALLRKAVANTTVAKKQDNVPSADLNYRNNTLLSYNSMFYVDDNFITELQNTQIIENFYNQKNLWEILIEIGYYIHAIPEIVFGENEKFKITFNRLGETVLNENQATPIMISNFRGIDDYISATNSYISNYVQLGGKITETVVPKSNSEDKLVYNDTAIAEVSFPITELLELKAVATKPYTFKDKGGTTIKTISAGEVADLTKFIYEKNVYNILSINPKDLTNKGLALYYNLYDNKIQGGDFQIPQSNTNIYTDYAIKKVIFTAFTGNYPVEGVDSATTNYWTNILINDFYFIVTYRTKDKVRQTHTRPDLRKYLVQSKWQDYPTYKQFNNQQDTLIDSEKFGSNMYGTLIRTGNTNYQMQEWVDNANNLKKKGELYKINDDLYYVAKVSNTYFVDHIESVVEYSKDYNQLSKVIGIPSEPRFYEIGEQSSIDRAVAIDDYLLITTDNNKLIHSLGSKEVPYLTNTEKLSKLIFGSTDTEENIDYSKYVITVFKGDNITDLPSTFGNPTFYCEIMTPLNAYSSGATLTYAWKMIDNFSAGDCVKSSGYNKLNTVDNSYVSLKAVKYTDEYGKATLFDFFILEDTPTLSAENVKNLPISPIHICTSVPYIHQVQGAITETQITNFCRIYAGREPIDNDTICINLNGTIKYYEYLNGTWNETSNFIRGYETAIYSADQLLLDRGNGGLVLLKDCRETLSFNYNLQTLTDSDQFVILPHLFTPKKDDSDKNIPTKVIALSEEVNKLSNGNLGANTVLAEYTLPTVVASGDMFTLKMSEITNLPTDTKAVAIAYGDNKMILARNLNNETALTDWHFGSPKKSNQQGTIFRNRA